jgi:hypothetical protein
VEAAGFKPANPALPAPCPSSQVRVHDALPRNKNHARDEPVCFPTPFIMLPDTSSGVKPEKLYHFLFKIGKNLPNQPVLCTRRGRDIADMRVPRGNHPAGLDLRRTFQLLARFPATTSGQARPEDARLLAPRAHSSERKTAIFAVVVGVSWIIRVSDGMPTAPEFSAIARLHLMKRLTPKLAGG